SRGYNRSACRRTAADASLRVLAHERERRVGIYRKRSVVGLAADITHRKHEIPRDPTLDRQAPLLVCGREQDRINATGSIDRARVRYRWPARRRKRYVLLQRK